MEHEWDNVLPIASKDFAFRTGPGGVTVVWRHQRKNNFYDLTRMQLFRILVDVNERGHESPYVHDRGVLVFLLHLMMEVIMDRHTIRITAPFDCIAARMTVACVFACSMAFANADTTDAECRDEIRSVLCGFDTPPREDLLSLLSSVARAAARLLRRQPVTCCVPLCENTTVDTHAVCNAHSFVCGVCGVAVSHTYLFFRRAMKYGKRQTYGLDGKCPQCAFV